MLLQKVAANDQAALPSRLECLYLLWRMAGDRQYLIQLFRLVQKSGNAEVGMGRSHLAKEFYGKDESMFTVLDGSKHTQDLPVAEERFVEVLNRCFPPRRTGAQLR